MISSAPVVRSLLGPAVVRVGARPTWVAGVDSGGTRSRLVAVRLHDMYEVQALGDGATPDDIGVARSAHNLVDLVSSALPNLADPVALIVGVGGLDLQDLRNELAGLDLFPTLV